MRQLKRGFNRCPERIFIEPICGRASGAAIHDSSNRNGNSMFCDILVDGVVSEARERIDGFIDLNFGFVGTGNFAKAQNRRYALLQFALGCQERTTAGGLCSRGHFAYCPENATPILTLRKRAGAAPCPVPIVCIGCPLPQFGVPQRVQCSLPQIESQLFQNSVVMPL